MDGCRELLPGEVLGISRRRGAAQLDVVIGVKIGLLQDELTRAERGDVSPLDDELLGECVEYGRDGVLIIRVGCMAVVIWKSNNPEGISIKPVSP